MFEVVEIEGQGLFDLHNVPWEIAFCVAVFWGGVLVGHEDVVFEEVDTRSFPGE